MRRRPDPAEYVLGTLAPGDLERGRRLEREDAAFAADVRALRAVIARLEPLEADEWNPAEPPALELEAVVPGAAPASSTPRRERRAWLGGLVRRLPGGSLALSPALAATAAVLLVAGGVLGGVLLSSDGDDAPAGETLALERYDDGPQGAAGRASIADVDGARELRIDASGLRPSGADDFYEVWLIRDASRMVSLGTFRVGEGGEAVVTLPVPVEPADYPIVDVSLEPADGTPTHSGKSVLRAPEGATGRA